MLQDESGEQALALADGERARINAGTEGRVLQIHLAEVDGAAARIVEQTVAKHDQRRIGDGRQFCLVESWRRTGAESGQDAGHTQQKGNTKPLQVFPVEPARLLVLVMVGGGVLVVAVHLLDKHVAEANRVCKDFTRVAAQFNFWG